MNGVLHGYGILDWGDFYTPEKLGPSVDLDHPAYKIYSIKNCAECHGVGEDRGPINIFAMDEKHVGQKIKNGSMPPREKFHKPAQNDRAYNTTILNKICMLYPSTDWTEVKKCLNQGPVNSSENSSNSSNVPAPKKH